MFCSVVCYDETFCHFIASYQNRVYFTTFRKQAAVSFCFSAENVVRTKENNVMAKVDITWINGQRYLAVDSSNHSVILSPPNDVGMKPGEMLLVSLATCTAYDVVKIVQKQRATLHRLEIEVTGEQQPDPPWPYTAIHLHFNVKAEKLSQTQLERAIDISMNQYCSVRASLSPNVSVTFKADLETVGGVEG
jgi:putative redox protein